MSPRIAGSLLPFMFPVLTSAAFDRNAVIRQLNDEFSCRILEFNTGERLTYRRDMSLPECDLLAHGNYQSAVALLNSLATTVSAQDAQSLREKARAYAQVGPDIEELARVRDRLFSLGVIRIENGQVRMSNIGHPFQREDHTAWLESYILAARRLARHLGSPVDTIAGACPEPACDRTIYRMAEAVTARPPLDWAFLREGDVIVPPSPYGLSYFSQHYAAASGIRRAIGFDPAQEWVWNPEIFASQLAGDGHRDVMFAELFKHEGIALVIGGWESKTEYPYVVPLFFMFQEARSVIDVLYRETSPLVKEVREIRYEPADGSGDLVALTRIPRGYRLSLRVLNPPEDLPVAEVRSRLHGQVRAHFKSMAELANR